MGEEYTVSVRLQSFNHSAYIREAIESVLAQKTTFRVELVCGDDFSTDNTLQILKGYESTTNVNIKILDRKVGDEYWEKRQRLGRLYNFTNIIEICAGKYIALLDGDDYWLDPYKLQKQVDFLESNPDCIACHHWHKYAVKNKTGEFVVVDAPIKGQGYYPERKASVEKIFANVMRVKSRTVMFRNVLDGFPSWFYRVAYGDVALSMILGAYGSFGFIDEPMAVYRQTGHGVSEFDRRKWHELRDHFAQWINVWEHGSLHHKGKYLSQALGTIESFYEVILLHSHYSLPSFFQVMSMVLFKSVLPVRNRLALATRLCRRFFWERLRRHVRGSVN